jgi:hypothetical protein
MIEEKKITVTFAPGAFDGFDGSQEELDQLIAEITKMIESGNFINNSVELDIDALAESDDPEDQLFLEKILNSVDDKETRILQ